MKRVFACVMAVLLMFLSVACGQPGIGSQTADATVSQGEAVDTAAARDSGACRNLRSEYDHRI